MTKLLELKKYRPSNNYGNHRFISFFEKHRCFDCKRKYVQDLMITYNPCHYKAKKVYWYCIRCYNKKFK